MVRILPNGDIVQDSVPKISRTDKDKPQQRHGFVQHAHEEEHEGAPGGAGGTSSVFENLNRKLLDAGVPRWNAGPFTVEPIVSVGFLAAGLLIGWRGLLFGGLLFLLCKWSSTGGMNSVRGWFSGSNTQGSRDNRRNNNFGGSGGHRLGR